MSSISVAVAGRSFHPTLQMRTAALPKMIATLIEIALSYLPYRSRTLSQSGDPGGYPLNPESSQIALCSSSCDLKGACDIPSMPTNSVVTP